MSKETKVVGYAHSSYNERRNFSGQNVEGYIFKKQKLDFFKVLDLFYFKIFNATKHLFHNFHLAINKCDLLHYFNGINLTSKPWIVTFEDRIPRTSHLINKGVRSLLKPNCKQLIALSQNAYDLQSDYLKENFSEHHDAIMEKTSVLHPPQKMLITDISEKKYGDKLTFTLIGADFFRKGGMEVLQAFDKILEKHKNIELNIISQMQYGDYASKTTAEDLENAYRIINKHPKNINHFKILPNPEVLELLKRTHISLLPTYSDTYGYSAIEAQACGCPVISTDIRALPEVNNNKLGYLIKVPKHKNGNGIIKTKEERSIFSKILSDEIEKVLHQICDNPSEIKIKGALCLDQIKTNHSIKGHAQKLQKIYDEALK